MTKSVVLKLIRKYQQVLLISHVFTKSNERECVLPHTKAYFKVEVIRIGSCLRYRHMNKKNSSATDPSMYESLKRVFQINAVK